MGTDLKTWKRGIVSGCSTTTSATQKTLKTGTSVRKNGVPPNASTSVLRSRRVTTIQTTDSKTWTNGIVSGCLTTTSATRKTSRTGTSVPKNGVPPNATANATLKSLCCAGGCSGDA